MVQPLRFTSSASFTISRRCASRRRGRTGSCCTALPAGGYSAMCTEWSVRLGGSSAAATYPSARLTFPARTLFTSVPRSSIPHSRVSPIE